MFLCLFFSNAKLRFEFFNGYAFLQEIQEEDSLNSTEKGSKTLELLSVVLKTIRTWIGQNFRGKLLQHYTLSANLTSEIEVRK